LSNLAPSQPFGNIRSSDPYESLKNANDAGSSVFNSSRPIAPTLTGNSSINPGSSVSNHNWNLSYEPPISANNGAADVMLNPNGTFGGSNGYALNHGMNVGAGFNLPGNGLTNMAGQNQTTNIQRNQMNQIDSRNISTARNMPLNNPQANNFQASNNIGMMNNNSNLTMINNLQNNTSGLHVIHNPNMINSQGMNNPNMINSQGMNNPNMINSQGLNNPNMIHSQMAGNLINAQGMTNPNMIKSQVMNNSNMINPQLTANSNMTSSLGMQGMNSSNMIGSQGMQGMNNSNMINSGNMLQPTSNSYMNPHMNGNMMNGQLSNANMSNGMNSSNQYYGTMGLYSNSINPQMNNSSALNQNVISSQNMNHQAMMNPQITMLNNPNLNMMTPNANPKQRVQNQNAGYGGR
jgi:hypothetical protein